MDQHSLGIEADEGVPGPVGEAVGLRHPDAPAPGGPRDAVERGDGEGHGSRGADPVDVHAQAGTGHPEPYAGYRERQERPARVADAARGAHGERRGVYLRPRRRHRNPPRQHTGRRRPVSVRGSVSFLRLLPAAQATPSRGGRGSACSMGPRSPRSIWIAASAEEL